MSMTVRVGELEIRIADKAVTIFQSSEDESKPLDFVSIRSALEATTLIEILAGTFGRRVFQRYAKALGARGGKKGGRARADKLSPERRSEIARAAARKRWEK